MAMDLTQTPESQRPVPGLLNLRTLAINKGRLSVQEVREVEANAQVLQMLLHCEFKERKIQHAAQNVLGLIYYQTNKKEQAIGQWEQTFQEDNSNLNAIYDLIASYESICDTRNIEKYKQAKMCAENFEQGSRDEAVVYARCQIEQALALFHDLQIASFDSCDIRSEQVAAFKKALTLGENLISDEEKRDWFFLTGCAYEKLSHTVFRKTGNSKKTLGPVREGFLYLKRSLEMSELPIHQAQVWCVIGSTFTRSWRDNLLQPLIQELSDEYPNMKQELQSVKGCYNKAFQLASDTNVTIWILAKYGEYFLKKRCLEEALEKLSESIAAAESLPDGHPGKEACRKAYVNRATTYKYMAREPNHRHYAVDLLDKASVDALKGVEITPNNQSFSIAAEVFYRLARYKDNQTEIELVTHESLNSLQGCIRLS